MKITFTEKKVAASDSLRAYAEKKLSKLDRYFKTDGEARVSFSLERGRHTTEITVYYEGMVYRASESTNDMYVSMDAAVAYIERQIHKYKTRLEKRLRQGAFERSATVHTEDPFVMEEQEFVIVRKKQFSMKPMTPEEAILQMNLLDHQFFAFRNFENGGVFAIVYRRNDGGYGLIEDN